MFSRIFFLAAFLATSLSVRAELVFSAPPREDAVQAAKIYGPLADALTRVLGEKVVFEAPMNWSDYGHSMRAGKYDFALDGPHFVAWRIANARHTPLVSLPGEISFWVAAQDGITSLDALRFQQVCGLPTPNLATLVLLSQFDPFRSPEIVAGTGGIRGVFNAFKENRCKAVVLRDMFMRNIPEAQARNLNIIYRSEPFPELTLTAGPRVPADKHQAILDALINDTGTATRTILESLGGKGATRLVAARKQAFAGYSRLLKDNAWGWNEGGAAAPHVMGFALAMAAH